VSRCCTAAILVLVGCCLSACTDRTAPAEASGAELRLVTLAPQLTELVFAAGAGETLVGASAYSDFPPAAAALPVVGDAFTVDHERLALLRPDILVAWQSGTPTHVVDELRAMGYRVEVLRTRRIADITAALRRIGELTGHADTAEHAASAFASELQGIRREHADADDISVFYQVSARPLYTVNGEHYVSELMELCGGSNIFADLGELAPAVDVEAVVSRDPEVMLASTDAGTDAFSVWSRWPQLAANRYGNHYLMPADQIGRATPRLAAAARALCDALDTARQRRSAALAP
jgi:iron complex transport system substrate-binding protein